MFHEVGWPVDQTFYYQRALLSDNTRRMRVLSRLRREHPADWKRRVRQGFIWVQRLVRVQRRVSDEQRREKVQLLSLIHI